jgi:tetratricopeptide (TPR) repeat protein
MAAIFISYSSNDRTEVEGLVSDLRTQYGETSVWWDRDLESREGFEPQISGALANCRVVVVVWSKTSISSKWVQAEASAGARDQKLINLRTVGVRIDEIPKPYNIYPLTELADRSRILREIASAIQGAPPQTAIPLSELYARWHGKEVLEPKRRKMPDDLSRISPSELLQARYALVEYDDATGMLARTLTWCISSEPALGLHIYGPGGLGKTRLMIEVADRLRTQHQWTAGFWDLLPQESAVAWQRWQALDQMIVHARADLLIVVDYAEARRPELSELAKRIGSSGVIPGRRIRLVLLTRSAGEWWSNIFNEDEWVRHLFQGQSDAPTAIAMPAFSGTRDWVTHFNASSKAFEPIMRSQGYHSSDLPRPNQSSIRSRERPLRPLAVQIEAMLWLASISPGQDSQMGVLIARVLGLERAHWGKVLGTMNEEQDRDLRRGVAQVTLVQGVDSARIAENLLMADSYYDDRTARASVDGVVRRLRLLYSDRGTERLLPLEPDLIGEHHVASVADQELIDGCMAWIGSLPEEDRPTREVNLALTLQRASNAEHGETVTRRACDLLDHLVLRHGTTLAPAIVVAIVTTPGLLLDRLSSCLDSVSNDALEQINYALPQLHVSLMEVSLRTANRFSQIARSELTGHPGAEESRRSANRQADALDILSQRLCHVGKHSEALLASIEAVEARPGAQESTSGDSLRYLSNSLSNQARELSHLNRHDEALAVSREVVAIVRELAMREENDGRALLARGLSNLGRDLEALGLGDEAIAAAREGLEIRRDLARTDPRSHLHEVAISLNNLGASLTKAGQSENGLAALREAVDVRRRLATAMPDMYSDDLASSLNNLCSALGRIERYEEGLAVVDEAISIRRRLSGRQPLAFLRRLALALLNRATLLRRLNRSSEATESGQEAVAICRKLVAHDANAFLRDLVVALGQTADLLVQRGRSLEAVADTIESLRILCQPNVLRASLQKPWIESLVGLYVRACQQSGSQPDRALVHLVLSKWNAPIA